jgi:hypothetical protein
VRGAFAFGGFQERATGFRIRVVELRDSFVETIAIFRGEVLKPVVICREPFEEFERGGGVRGIVVYARPSSSLSIRVL